MTKARHEKPQKGNPHELTINQHVLPVASIARFAGGDQRVDLCDTLRGINRRATPADEIFCARRAWTNREEKGFMKSIEDAFQALARNILDGTVSAIGDAEKTTVDNFYSLWLWRADRRSLPEQELPAKMVTGTPRTKDEEEALEKAGMLFIREGGTIPARQINGAQLYHLVYRYAQGPLADTPWGIIRAHEGEFLVPDTPAQVAIVPLTPTLCLVANAPNGTITKQNLADINRTIKLNSREYFFAHDLASCFQ